MPVELIIIFMSGNTVTLEIEIDESVHRNLKEYCRKNGKDFNAVLCNILRNFTDELLD